LPAAAIALSGRLMVRNQMVRKARVSASPTELDFCDFFGCLSVRQVRSIRDSDLFIQVEVPEISEGQELGNTSLLMVNLILDEAHDAGSRAVDDDAPLLIKTVNDI
jgi:hypothetical protein